MLELAEIELTTVILIYGIEHIIHSFIGGCKAKGTNARLKFLSRYASGMVHVPFFEQLHDGDSMRGELDAKLLRDAHVGLGI